MILNVCPSSVFRKKGDAQLLVIEKTMSVYYLIDDRLTVIPTKVFYEQSETRT